MIEAQRTEQLAPVTSMDFAPYLWHDNLIRSLRLDIGDHELGDWHSDLVLDIDHLVGWGSTTIGKGQFRVAPATLAFHDAGDLRISIDCGDSGGQVALHDLSIDQITRELVKERKVCLHRPFYCWRIELNWPKGGLISFAASGFTQVLRAEPVLSETVRLPAKYRTPSTETKQCG